MENHLTNNPENIEPKENVLYKEAQGTYIATTLGTPSIQEKKERKWLIPVLILLIVLTLATTAFFAYQNMQLKKQSDPTAGVTFSPSPILEIPLPSSSSSTNQLAATNDFTHQNFRITYPSDWIFSDLNSSNNFPLKKRLQSLYEQGKVVALSKDGTHLLISIENASDGGAGGIFTTVQEYEQFLTDKDILTIFNLASFSASSTEVF